MLLENRAFFNKIKYIFSIWLLLPFINWKLDFFRGRCNNYVIFRQVYYHVISKVNLYLYYPKEYDDSNHYGPLFSIVVAPFALLPDVAGYLLWTIFNAMVLMYALNKLPLAKPLRIMVMVLCSIEMANSMWSNQFNSAEAAMIVMSFVLVEKKKDFWATAFIILGTFVKLYAIIGLVFFLFSKDKWMFIKGCIFWALIFYALPMLISSPSYINHTYLDWYMSLVEKNDINVSLTSSTDASVMGIVRRVLQDASIPNWPFILGGLILYLIPFLRFKDYKSLEFRLLILSSSLSFIILFSSSSEHPTYIYPMIGVAIWYVLQGEKMKSPVNITLLLFVLLLGGLSPTDAFTKPVRTFVIDYSLKALPFAVAWGFILKDLFFKKFSSADFNGEIFERRVTE